MKRRLFLYCLIFTALAVLVSCSKDKGEKKFIDAQGNEQTVSLIRFDKAMFEKPVSTVAQHVSELYRKYPEMFYGQDTNVFFPMVANLLQDERMLEAQGIVEKEYADVSSIEKEMTSAFARLKKEYPKTELPKRVFTYIMAPTDYSVAFSNRVAIDRNFSAIALDVYCMDKLAKHPYYSMIPEYMRPTLTKDFIVSDYMRAWLKYITFSSIPLAEENPMSTLLDNIIDDGKYSYVLHCILPETGMDRILRYTPTQMQWVEKNEKVIWGYIMQTRLLYEKDRSRYLSLISEGPDTKNLQGSPSRVGNYVGYKIVEKFMDEEKISIDSLMHITDASVILKKSKYKPEKR